MSLTMPRPDAAELVGKNLQALPHPDGHLLRFLNHSSFGQPDEVREHVNGLAKGVGEAVVNLLEINGYTLAHRDDPKPVDAAGMKFASIRCTGCDGVAMHVALDDELQGHVDVSKIKQECPHG